MFHVSCKLIHFHLSTIVPGNPQNHLTASYGQIHVDPRSCSFFNSCWTYYQSILFLSCGLGRGCQVCGRVGRFSSLLKNGLLDPSKSFRAAGEPKCVRTLKANPASAYWRNGLELDLANRPFSHRPFRGLVHNGGGGVKTDLIYRLSADLFCSSHPTGPAAHQRSSLGYNRRLLTSLPFFFLPSCSSFYQLLLNSWS